MSDTKRHPLLVGRQIRALIPEEHHPRLDKVLVDMMYKAPEQEMEMWDMLARVLNQIVPFPPTEHWQCEAISVLTTKPIEEVKLTQKVLPSIKEVGR